MYLLKIEAAVSTQQVETEVKKYLNKFFSEYKLPVPTVKIVDRMTSHWLGRCLYRPHVDKFNSTIEIQKSILNDEHTLGRVICHELIHHFNFMLTYGHPEHGDVKWQEYCDMRKKGFKDDAHGKLFHEWAAKINSVMGADYVTEKSDTSYVEEVTKEYFLLIAPSHRYKTEYSWAWALKPSEDQKQVIQRSRMDQGGKLFMSKDKRWVTGQKIKKFGSMSIPLDTKDKEKLKELYNSGTDIKPSWPEPIARLSDMHRRTQTSKEMENILKNDPLGVLVP